MLVNFRNNKSIFPTDNDLEMKNNLLFVWNVFRNFYNIRFFPLWMYTTQIEWIDGWTKPGPPVPSAIHVWFVFDVCLSIFFQLTYSFFLLFSLLLYFAATAGWICIQLHWRLLPDAYHHRLRISITFIWTWTYTLKGVKLEWNGMRWNPMKAFISNR